MPDGPQAVGSASIGAVLASRGLLSGAALERARRLEAETGERIDRVAAKLGLVSERDLAAAYAELIGSPIVAAADFPTEPVAAQRMGPLGASVGNVVVSACGPFGPYAGMSAESAAPTGVRL